ncbi:MAG: HAMP domain-containing protein [Deltaproteobacteria bacterium]|jgi:two-component system nitrogen regulation sensor histidine kinase NtrY|nr:HAMP domain-containing protein [Deltaproteobacteria bacterium]
MRTNGIARPGEPGVPEVAKETMSPEKKKKGARSMVILAFLGLLFLIIVQRRLLNLGPGLSSNQGVITLVSINFSVLALVFLLYLLVRGLYRVFFEFQDYGSLQTKMVVSFIGLSLIPTMLIFYFAYLLIGQDHKTWFGDSVRNSIVSSMEVLSGSIESEEKLFELSSQMALLRFKNAGADPGAFRGESAALEAIRVAGNLDTLEWYGPDGGLLGRAPGVRGDSPPPVLSPSDFRPGEDRREIDAETATGPLTRLILPANGGTGDAAGAAPAAGTENGNGNPPRGYLVAGTERLAPLRARLADLKTNLEKYEAALGIERPFKVSKLTTLAAVTLVAVFFSVWTGSHLAGSLAAPVTELVEGTQKVAAGDYDFVLVPVTRSGEMAQLVDSFNRMTARLKESYAELEDRNRFVEIVLRQVSTGVMLLDENLKVMDVNESGLKTLGISLADAKGDPVPECLLAIMNSPDSDFGSRGRALLRENKGETLSLMVSKARLVGEDRKNLGWLVTFDDVSELEKVQRLAAWKEVARRVAHEVKNPLTPLSLAAERIQMRFSKVLTDPADLKVLNDSTRTIGEQAMNIKQLVDEFTRYDNLPKVNPRPDDITRVAEHNLVLFRDAYPGVKFTLNVKNAPRTLSFDSAQIGRVISNLLNNSVSAVKNRGEVEIDIDTDEFEGAVVSISDDGPGLPRDIKDAVFEPYVTTGSGGRGLGLSIVKTIIDAHGGDIRVADHKPRGTTFKFNIPFPGEEAGFPKA